MGLAITQKVLARPELAALELFSFRAYGSRKRLVIRLDKVSVLCYGCCACLWVVLRSLQSPCAAPSSDSHGCDIKDL